MFFKKKEELFKELSKLDSLELNFLIIDLIKSGTLNYIQLSKIYVEHLEKCDKQKSCSINTLGLMLGSYCIRDTSDLGKTSRRHLFESGMYTKEDKSIFGIMLSEEFDK